MPSRLRTHPILMVNRVMDEAQAEHGRVVAREEPIAVLADDDVEPARGGDRLVRNGISVACAPSTCADSTASWRTNA